jgi:hypothetical protein
MAVTLALLLAASATVQPADAPPPPAEPGAIVVQGQRVSEKQIRDFIRERLPGRGRPRQGSE